MLVRCGAKKYLPNIDSKSVIWLTKKLQKGRTCCAVLVGLTSKLAFIAIDASDWACHSQRYVHETFAIFVVQHMNQMGRYF